MRGSRVGQSHLPLKRPGYDIVANIVGRWIAATTDLEEVRTINNKGLVQVQRPPYLMFGCHKRNDEQEFKEFSQKNTAYDEYAYWPIKLVINQTMDQTLYLDGGYSKN